MVESADVTCDHLADSAVTVTLASYLRVEMESLSRRVSAVMAARWRNANPAPDSPGTSPCPSAFSGSEGGSNGGSVVGSGDEMVAYDHVPADLRASFASLTEQVSRLTRAAAAVPGSVVRRGDGVVEAEEATFIYDPPPMALRPTFVALAEQVSRLAKHALSPKSPRSRDARISALDTRADGADARGRVGAARTGSPEPWRPVLEERAQSDLLHDFGASQGPTDAESTYGYDSMATLAPLRGSFGAIAGHARVAATDAAAAVSESMARAAGRASEAASAMSESVARAAEAGQQRAAQLAGRVQAAAPTLQVRARTATVPAAGQRPHHRIGTRRPITSLLRFRPGSLSSFYL